ncbi:DNA-binding response regulator [Xanthomonas campestris pv. campestris]|uniref:Two-component system regulatory protein n=1 Tax=Xanthomonas campestris pv. campestris (strain B100) TaxID=509169 RepID=B0RXR4_XANCB|nr:response regulator transcription factor [Xanthomonas campestris]MDO0841286.1 response regulator transcription factor [Xanthomonas campestris pv. campestris]MDO0845579.1 response regulator transcription factor [Xanthomonas campestris pv. campestris]MEA0620571.1 response regulator transcription factor [Xanthomonas campestris pv. campestris]MEA0624325.1 response regulator transcription factor [Xanthomonas campestris pv. campestris]MEA0644807.1 response regulator transcription factor [Xanthomon
MHLLLVEDDTMLADAICDGVRQQSWTIDHVGTAAAARTALVEHHYTAVLLDIGLPGDSGLTVIRYMRGHYDPTPVIALTARGQLTDRIRGLDAGADDYLVKPFQFDELMARVRAIARRSHGRVVPLLTQGEVSVDPSSRKVTRNGKWVALSAHEYRLLLALMERAGRVVTKDQLEEGVYGGPSEGGSNMIAVYVHQLRRKLGDEAISTIYGQGYMIGQAPE